VRVYSYSTTFGKVEFCSKRSSGDSLFCLEVLYSEVYFLPTENIKTLILFKDCSVSRLDDVSLRTRRRYAKEGDRVVDAHRLERLVFVNNEANKASNPMAVFPSPGSRTASVHGAGDISVLRKNRRERGETKRCWARVFPLRRSLAYQAPQLLSLLDGKIVADEHISFFVEGDLHGNASRDK